jgi:hypothetical protein
MSDHDEQQRHCQEHCLRKSLGITDQPRLRSLHQGLVCHFPILHITKASLASESRHQLRCFDMADTVEMQSKHFHLLTPEKPWPLLQIHILCQPLDLIPNRNSSDFQELGSITDGKVPLPNRMACVLLHPEVDHDFVEGGALVWIRLRPVRIQAPAAVTVTREVDLSCPGKCPTTGWQSCCRSCARL